MDFDEYKYRVDYYLANDNREENYQNRVVIPLFESIFAYRYDVIDVSQLTKEWDNRGICRDRFAGIHTPDILVAKKWTLYKDDKSNVDYKIILEIKTPTAEDRDHAEREVEEYLSKKTPVILTDCVSWEFYDGDEMEMVCLEENHSILHISRNKRYRKQMKLQSCTYEFPVDICSGRKIKTIKWTTDESVWKELINKIYELTK